MDKINQFSSFKSGNNQKRMSNSPYDNLKRSYYDYIEQTNKSDFANSPRRYIVELSFIKNLKSGYLPDFFVFQLSLHGFIGFLTQQPH